MSEKEKMINGEKYNPMVPELEHARIRAKELCQQYNSLSQNAKDEKKNILEKLLGKIENTIIIEQNFFCDYGFNIECGENFYIKITYIPDSIIDKQKKMTASEVIKELSPNSPNINNLGKQHESIYNQSIMLEDREVTALVIEYKNDNRNSTIFVYDDLLVEIKSNPEVWSTQWFATLSFDDFTE